MMEGGGREKRTCFFVSRDLVAAECGILAIHDLPMLALCLYEACAECLFGLKSGQAGKLEDLKNGQTRRSKSSP